MPWHELVGTNDLGTARHARIWHILDLTQHGMRSNPYGPDQYTIKREIDRRCFRSRLNCRRRRICRRRKVCRRRNLFRRRKLFRRQNVFDVKKLFYVEQLFDIEKLCVVEKH